MQLSSFASMLKAIINIQHKISTSAVLGMNGMSAIDALAICVLADKSSTSKYELTRHLNLRRGQTDRLLDAFKKNGYVTVTSEDDPKLVMVSLTVAGQNVHEQLEKMWDTWIKKNPDGRTALANIRTGVRTMQSTLAAS
jgi:DNA-binding MarR family transcriptional regulator